MVMTRIFPAGAVVAFCLCATLIGCDAARRPAEPVMTLTPAPTKPTTPDPPVADPVPASDPLGAFVERPDAAYGYEVVERRPLDMADAYRIRLTSQVWDGRPWTHAVTLIIPHQRRSDGGGVLLITGGINPSPGEEDAADLTGSNMPDRELAVLGVMAASLGRPTVVLEQVPNQPLLGGLYEDEIIARTFAGYLRDPEQPAESLLLFPMVKAAARAMDAARAVAGDEAGVTLDRFVVTGSSKRGWTTWLIAAVDPRVVGIMPRVIDLLNLQAQVAHQWKSYGRFSHMLDEYVAEGVVKQMTSPRGRALTALVDPFAYRDRLQGVPKLVILGANDPYWVADSSSLYFGDLPGPKYLCIVPNVGHSFQQEVLGTMAAFVERCLSSQASRGEPLPIVAWSRQGGAVTVRWEAGAGGYGEGFETRATAWRAVSGTRDFRGSRWVAEHLGPLGRGETLRVEVSHDEGRREGQWEAMFVEVTFTPPGSAMVPLMLTTEVVVTPEEFPFRTQ